MTNQEAIEIINKNRIKNPFTMGLSLNDFVEQFRRRYLIINNQVLSNNYIDIATTMLDLDNNYQN